MQRSLIDSDSEFDKTRYLHRASLLLKSLSLMA